MLAPPTFKQSRETEICYSLFRTIRDRSPQLITWNELCDATGKDRDQIANNIHTALRRALNDDGLVIENDRDVGYRLRTDGEINGCGQRAIEHTRRVQRVGLKKMNCADMNRLTPEERATHNVRKSVLELGLLSSRPRTISNVNQMVIRKHNELDEREMVEAIRVALTR